MQATACGAIFDGPRHDRRNGDRGPPEARQGLPAARHARLACGKDSLEFGDRTQKQRVVHQFTLEPPKEFGGSMTAFVGLADARPIAIGRPRPPRLKFRL